MTGEDDGLAQAKRIVDRAATLASTPARGTHDRLVVLADHEKPPRPLGTIERAILMAAEQAAVTAYDDTADGIGDVIRIDDLRDILARSTELRGAAR